MGDAEVLAAIYSPYVTGTVITFELEPPTADDFRRRIEKITTDYPYIVMEIDGEIVGYAYASRYRERAAYNWDVESSIYLRMDCRQKGLGKVLYTELLNRLQARGFYNVYACVTVPNERSIAFHRRLGFEDVGIFHKSGCKFAAWHDIMWLEKRLEQEEDIP
ncbi:hypothetical protein FACS1894208_09850 [Clostridia bacterium]|nr:hypothetical protein FACS1894208_09850 [Clostridia bacterium]